jgi:hypothetical protein
MRRSLEAAEALAAAAGKSAATAADTVEAAIRRRREDMEREVHSAAHKLMATAGMVAELARQVPGTVKTLFALAGHSGLAEKAAPYEREKELRQKAVAEALTEGSLLIMRLKQNPPDKELTEGLWDMDKQLVRIELMKEDVTRQLENLNSEIASQRDQNAAAPPIGGGG